MNESYKDKFNATMKQFGINSLDDLKSDEDKKKLEKRGNVMENFSPESGPLSSKYESLEGTISRMGR